MAIINVLTDFKYDPLYTSMLMNYLRLHSKHTIFESTHSLPSQNLVASAFIIKQIFKQFPKNTIHLVCVKTSSTKIKQYLAFKYQGQYFIVADNGIINLITDGNVIDVVAIESFKTTFPELDIMAPAAIKLANTLNLFDIGKPVENFVKKEPFLPTYYNNRIIGYVIYIDSYGNAMTNISKEFFDRYRRGRRYEIYVNYPINYIKSIDNQYSSEAGKFVAIFNRFGLLEVSVVEGNAAQLLDLKELSSKVVITFI